MRRRLFIWLLLILACVLGVLYFWRPGPPRTEEHTASTNPRSTSPTAKAFNLVTPRPEPETNSYVKSASTAPVIPGQPKPTNSLSPIAARLKYRLSNTPSTIGELAASDRAVLLENALIDSSLPVDFTIPDSLRSKGDPGSYIVQARGPLDDAFRAQLRMSGASIVSYIPNNAYLVRASAAVAQQLAAHPQTQAVLPYEPYYKLKSSVLKNVMEQRPVPLGAELVVVIFPDARANTIEALERLGATVVSESPSPFGPQVTVANVTDVSALAVLPGVQIVQAANKRIPANDLSRPRMRVTRNSTTTTNYLDLTGSNIVVAVVDSGIDATHPDFGPPGPPGRVLGFALTDTEGHGTHVAGIIGGNGGQSLSISNAPIGSVTPLVTNQFRGQAPAASLLALPVGTTFSDFELQEMAQTNNALISNNSWGYGDSGYDIAAASYDAATRDARPSVTGSQGLVFVFAAGNSGFGGDNGVDGFADTLSTPATAKNVISVGAIEQFRDITNETFVCQACGGLSCATNQPWGQMTDSDDEVAGFSSRGNVGIGVEGEFGRFKPDVVAPGVMVVSARSAQWDTNAYYNPTNFHITLRLNQVVETNVIHRYSEFIPCNTVQWLLDSFPLNITGDLPLYVKELPGFATTANPVGFGPVTLAPPTLHVDTTYSYAVGNPTNITVRYDVLSQLTATNDNGNYFQVLSNMNESIGPSYRYESGTSMAAPAVSGVLALMEEFFVSKKQMQPSPALMKALLINGARRTGLNYFLEVRNEINYQGWGTVNLTNTLPVTLLTNGSPIIGTPMMIFDQSPTNTIASGESRTLFIDLSANTNAANLPLRITLVWTDPPGNPAAGVKLVNDLDLVVTNYTDPVHPLIYFGNDIQDGANFNFPWETNLAPMIDFVNNVENVYIDTPVGQRYSVTVKARRVNVNAVTAHANDVVQDYALVISSGDGSVTNALRLASATPPTFQAANIPDVTVITNMFPPSDQLPGQRVSGGLLQNQRVGASSPLIPANNISLGTNTMWGVAGTNGMISLGVTNQWHFYYVSNEFNFTNAAFVTFLAPNMSDPVMGVTSADHPDEITRPEADIDLYVSTDSSLTNLNPAAVAAADKSLGRGGTEVIAYTNALPGQVFYVGIHSEDQEASEYGFFGGFSESPFSTGDENGVLMRGFPLPREIPDGNAARPGIARVLAISVSPVAVRRVVVTNEISHENFGDLVVDLSHNSVHAILHNHTFGNGNFNQTTIYEDNGEGNVINSQHTDGPGSLTDFVGEEGAGVWMSTFVDNGFSHTGRVENLMIHLDPQLNTNGSAIFDIQPNTFVFDFIDVPPEATNLTISVVNISASPGPLFLFVKRGELPTLTSYDYTMVINPPGGQMVITPSDLPPLRPGRYFIGIFNPNSTVQTVRLTMTVGLNLNGVPTIDFTSAATAPILDDAVTTSTIFVSDNQKIVRAEVGVALNHPRVSDLTMTLVSPAGKRILLMENRGGTTSVSLGGGTVTTNFLGTFTPGSGPTANTNDIGPVPTSGNLIIDYQFFGVPDTIDVYYEGVNILSTGPLFNSGTVGVTYGPGTATNIIIIINQNGNPDAGTAWQFTPRVVSLDSTFFLFTENTNTAHLPIKFAQVPFVPPTINTNIPILGGPIRNPTNGHYYYLLGNNTWTASEAWAVGVGGHLATINDAAENDWVFDTFANLGSPRSLWIGFNDVATEGTFSWINGEPVTFTNWFAGEPNNGLGGGEDYTYIMNYPGTERFWNDYQDLPAIGGIEPDLFGVAEALSLPSTNIAYLPEEPLKALVGDRAFGEWKLEIWDNRVGMPLGDLVAWQLRFIFELEAPVPQPLPPFVPVTNTIPCGFTYFTVDVPIWASYATNIIISSTGPVDVWFNQNTPPIGGPADTLLINDGITGSSATLSSNSVPPLIPGARYYLGVSNVNCGTNVTFVIEVDYDITALTNAIPYTNSMPFSPIPRYFLYDVSSNATAVSYQLLNLTGNLNLYARRGFPLPTATSFDYSSDNPGTFDEDIIVFNNSTPVPLLAPGRWFLGVFNAGVTPANYTILATEYTDPIPPIINVTNGIPVTNGFPLVPAAIAGHSVDYYHYEVSPNAARVQFEIINPTGDMILVARKGLPLPTQTNYAYYSDNPYTNNELIVIFTNSLPQPLSPGNWYIGAINPTDVPVAYIFKATEFPVTGRPLIITDMHFEGSGTNTSFCITWTSVPGIPYFVQGVPNLLEPWVTISPTIVATNFTTTYCIPLPSPYRFFRVGEGNAFSTFIGPPIIHVKVLSAGILLEWDGPPTASYNVQWTPSIAPLVSWNTFTNTITSTNRQFSFLDDGSQTGGLAAPRYYRVRVLP